MRFGNLVYRVVRITEGNKSAEFDIRSETEGNVHRRDVVEFQNRQRQFCFQSAAETDLPFECNRKVYFVCGRVPQKLKLVVHHGFAVVAVRAFSVSKGRRFNVMMSKFDIQTGARSQRTYHVKFQHK